MSEYDIRRKTLYNAESGKMVLVQVGNKFFRLKEENVTDNVDAFCKILDNNDVYLLKKGD